MQHMMGRSSIHLFLRVISLLTLYTFTLPRMVMAESLECSYTTIWFDKATYRRLYVPTKASQNQSATGHSMSFG